MCLNKKQYVRLRKDSEGRYYGWKYIVKIDGVFYLRYGGVIEFEKWLVAEDKRVDKIGELIASKNPIGCHYGPIYKPGFHINALKRDSVYRTRFTTYECYVVKVFYKDPIITGITDGEKVIVANQIFFSKKSLQKV